jgi:hypothetical protein
MSYWWSMIAKVAKGALRLYLILCVYAGLVLFIGWLFAHSHLPRCQGSWGSGGGCYEVEDDR